MSSYVCLSKTSIPDCGPSRRQGTKLISGTQQLGICLYFVTILGRFLASLLLVISSLLQLSSFLIYLSTLLSFSLRKSFPTIVFNPFPHSLLSQVFFFFYFFVVGLGSGYSSQLEFSPYEPPFSFLLSLTFPVRILNSSFPNSCSL